ncbi:MAG TPA: ATP-dependent DNA helicase [Methanosarcinales archaeon]|nr:ATP-dependent DNA helicase [Methanosarcinales archaeon]
MNYTDYFPYQKFRPCQKEMLDKVTSVVQKGGHGVLMIDAPTGSGKTSIISALLANKGDKKIVVALRTISQVNIYLDEIKKIRTYTDKRPTVAYLVGKSKMCKLGSELKNVYTSCDLLKIFTKNKLDASLMEQIRKQGNTVYNASYDMEIKDALDEEDEGYRTFCPYYLFSKEIYKDIEGSIRFRDSRLAISDSKAIISDILYPEQLKKHCTSTCPYEVMAISAKSADIIILNYYHIFDSKYRKLMYSWLGIKEENTILVVDEAHNLGNVVRDINTNSINTYIIDRAIKEIETFKRTKGKPLDEIVIASSVLFKIKEYLENIRVNRFAESEELFDPVKFGDYIYSETLKRDDSAILRELLKLAMQIKKHKQRNKENAEAEVFLEYVVNFLYGVYFALEDPFFIPVQSLEKSTTKKKVTLSILNVDPSFEINSVVDKNYATIMISGTFSPTRAYELYYFGKVGRAEILSLPNTFPKENRLILGAKSATTQSSYRNSPENKKEIEKCIKSAIIGIKGNVALWFTSYEMMYQYSNYCKAMAKKAKKTVFIEPKEAERVPYIINSFFDSGINKSKKFGILLAVCGGKLSEGIDYRGETLRGALVIGLPLASYSVVQRAINTYFQKKYGNKNGMFISYTLPAINKAMQAIGRVHRASNEKGVLFLCDSRFTKTGGLGVRQYLPKWINEEMMLCKGESALELIEKWNKGILNKEVKNPEQVI